MAVVPNEKDISEQVDRASRREWWQQADPELIALYRTQTEQTNRKLVRIGIWTAAIANALFGAFDYLLIPDVASYTIAMRIMLGVVFIGAVEVCLAVRVKRDHLEMVTAGGIVCGALVWLAVSSQTVHQQDLSHYLVHGAFFILGVNLFFNFRLKVAVSASTVVGGCFCAFAFLSPDLHFASKLSIISFYLIGLGLSLYLSWRFQAERHHTFVQTLLAQIQERKAREQGLELRKIAFIDPLTGLMNRRAVSRHFSVLQRQCMKSGQTLFVLLADVDFFKRYNDALGHQAGDECLKTIAEAIGLYAEERGAFAGRHGGEEFVMIGPLNEGENVDTIADGFCKWIEALGLSHPSRVDDVEVVTVSAGIVADYPLDSQDFNTLLQHADRALYNAKYEGRARHSVFDPNAINQDAEAHLRDLLRTACEQDRVVARYQPIVDGETGVIMGYETLMRLMDDDGSHVSPNLFIPIAESTNVIHDLGSRIMRFACEALAEPDGPEFLTVNVSGVQLAQPGFALRVAHILSQTGAQPGKLAIEVTEGSDVLSDPQSAINLQELRALGTRIWLDDFGSGFAGLSWLREFDFDVVKIDRGFLVDCQNKDGIDLLEDMVALLRNRDVKILVEGVESEDQYKLLQTLGVDMVQGYLFGRPGDIQRPELRKVATG